MYLAKQNGSPHHHIRYDAHDLRNCQLLGDNRTHIQVKTKLVQSWTPVSKEYSGQNYGFMLYNGHVVNVRWTVIFHKSFHKLCKMSNDHQPKYLFLQWLYSKLWILSANIILLSWSIFSAPKKMLKSRQKSPLMSLGVPATEFHSQFIPTL